MEPQAIFKTAHQYQETYSNLQSMGMHKHLRIETAKRLGISTPQADRYARFNDLIPEVQNLVRDYGAGMSSLLSIATHPAIEQRAIYEILLDAWNEGTNLKREFIKQVVNRFRDGKRSWLDIKPDCSEFIVHPKKIRQVWHRPFDTSSPEDVRHLSGRDFEIWFADLLRMHGYVAVNITQHSYDKGADIIASKDNVQYIFQCKNTPVVGIKALQEIWFAKRPFDHVAVIVTTGNIAAAARKIAAERGIQCWSGGDLSRLAKESQSNRIVGMEVPACR